MVMTTCEKFINENIASACDGYEMQDIYSHAGKGMSSIDQVFNVQVKLPTLSN